MPARLGPIDVPCPLCGETVPVHVRLEAERQDDGDPRGVRYAWTAHVDQERLAEDCDAHLLAHHRPDGP